MKAAYRISPLVDKFTNIVEILRYVFVFLRLHDIIWVLFAQCCVLVPNAHIFKTLVRTRKVVRASRFTRYVRSRVSHLM